MLALSRRESEAIWIGGNVKISVLEIRGETVRLGISAPDNVSINREEVELAIKQREETGEEVSPAEIRELLRARNRGIDRGEKARKPA